MYVFMCEPNDYTKRKRKLEHYTKILEKKDMNEFFFCLF